MIIQLIENNINIGQVIPKPKAKENFTIKGWGKRRNERALIYFIPNHKNSGKPYQKGITITEFEIAYNQIKSSSNLTRKWFNEKLSNCAKEGSCNYTTIGGIFELLGVAKYKQNGEYKLLY